MIKEFTAYTLGEIVTKLPDECSQFAAMWDAEEEHWEVSYAASESVPPDNGQIA